jgi:hypothetical protein
MWSMVKHIVRRVKLHRVRRLLSLHSAAVSRYPRVLDGTYLVVDVDAAALLTLESISIELGLARLL